MANSMARIEAISDKPDLPHIAFKEISSDHEYNAKCSLTDE